MARCITRPPWPIYKVSFDEEKLVLQIAVVCARVCNNWYFTNPCDQLILALFDIMFFQVVRVQDLSNFALDPMTNAKALQGNQYSPCVRHQLAWCDHIVIAHDPN